jgi:hypothetical protein
MRELFLENTFFRVCVILAAAGVLSLATTQPRKGLFEELSEGNLPKPGFEEAIKVGDLFDQAERVLKDVMDK